MSIENFQEGRDNLANLGKSKHVMHLADINANIIFSEDSLIASQGIPGIV